MRKMQFLCLTILLPIAIYGSTIPKQCPGKCDAIRCAAPLCESDEVLKNGDGDCQCCPSCVKDGKLSRYTRDAADCSPYLCAAVFCIPPDNIAKSCKPNEQFVPPDQKCNCCGKCV